MLDVISVILAFINGATVGVVAIDWRLRRKALEELRAERQKMSEAVAAVAASVNPLVLTVQQMQERLGAQEMRNAQMNRPR